MSLTQREYDVRQLEAELKMQKLFDEWRRAFLAERLLSRPPQQPPQAPPQEAMTVPSVVGQ